MDHGFMSITNWDKNAKLVVVQKKKIIDLDTEMISQKNLIKGAEIEQSQLIILNCHTKLNTKRTNLFHSKETI